LLKVGLLPSLFRLSIGIKISIILVANGAVIAPINTFWEQKSINKDDYDPF
jgi:hypothetical protein